MIPRYSHVGGTVWRDAGTPEEYVVGVCATEQDARDDVAARNAYEPSRLRIARDSMTNPERALRESDARIELELMTKDRNALRAKLDGIIADLRGVCIHQELDGRHLMRGDYSNEWVCQTVLCRAGERPR